MGALKTCCGLYYSLTSIVGVYFFIVMAIMNLRGNMQVKYDWNAAENETKWTTAIGFEPDAYHQDKKQPDTTDKAIAYFILAAIQLGFAGACFVCGTNSLREDLNDDKMVVEDDMDMADKPGYQRVEDREPGVTQQ